MPDAGGLRAGGLHAGSLDTVATTVQRLGVLLGAGVAPASAWGYLAESLDHEEQRAAASHPPGRERSLRSGSSGSNGTNRTKGGQGNGVQTRRAQSSRAQSRRIIRGVATRAAAVPVAEALLTEVRNIPEPIRSTGAARVGIAWRGLAAAWLVASDAGAPLAPSLRGFAQSLQDLAETQREVEVALAGPAATAKFVTVLPLVGILFGLGLGFDTLGVLFGTAAGAVCLVAGVALMLAARAWNRRMLRGATPKDPAPGLPLELLAIAVSGGASLDRARQSVAEALDRCGLAGSGDEDAVLELSRRAGVPAGLLLRSEAEQVRRIARSTARRKAAALSVTLMIPLGLCVLPAFLLLGVAPLMIAVFSSTVGQF